MAGKTKSVDGVEHPASDFAYVGDPEKTDTWHLPDFDEKHARLATEMFGRTEGMSDPKKKSATAARIARKAKAHGVDTGNFEKAHGVKMSDFNNQWVEIFRAGDYGEKGVWTRDDLDKTIANFSAGVWNPPAVFGHPKEDDPAQGWVADLRRVGDVLEARFTQTSDELESSVRNGRFPNRSAAFYLDARGTGPVLRHVGFLGATPPEVKGLEPVNFSDGEFVAIEFSEEETMDPQQIKNSIRDYFAELFGRRERRDGDATFTEAQVQERITAATKPLTDAINGLRKEFQEGVREAREAAQNANAEGARAKARAFVDKLKAANKWVPALSEMGLDAVLEDLAVSGRKIKFGEAGKQKEEMSFDRLCAFLESQNAIVPKGDLVVRTGKNRSKVIRFNETRNVQIDPSSLAINNRAEEIVSESNGKITFGEALIQARKEFPEGAAAMPGGITAGGA